MKYFLISIVCVFTTIYVEAQSPQLKQKLMDAEYFFLNEDYEQALKYFKDILKMDPKNFNVNYKIGLCYQRMPFEAGRSIPYLQKAVTGLSKTYVIGSITEKKAPIQAMYNLAFAYHINKYYDEAIAMYQRFIDTIQPTDLYFSDLATRQLQSCRNAKEISKKPIGVEIFNVGNSLNSPFDESNPCVTADGKYIYFTRLVTTKPKTKTGEDDAIKVTLKIMSSEFLGGEKWSDPKDISEELQTLGTCNTVSINADGTFMILYRNGYYSGGIADFKGGMLFYSERKSVNDKWSPIKKFNNNINTSANETFAMLSPDGQELYFTSDMKGGYGGLDIYVSKLVKGKWGVPTNLGPIVNTQYNEETPIISEDGKTLYFSSEGHYNMGGFDIFKSVKMSDKIWSEPENIGSPINSPDDNLNYFPFLHGKQAFYALARYEGYFTFGGMDIYQCEFIDPEPVQPISEIPIKLEGVVSFDDNKVIDSTMTISVVDFVKKDTISVFKPKPNGEYSIFVPPGEYNIVYKRPSYNLLEKHIIITKSDVEKTVTLHAKLYPEEVNKKYFVIRNIYFDLNSSELNADALVEVKKLLEIMKENPGLYIEVIGNADSFGKDEVNQKLSEARSRKVIDYLVQNGVEAERFVSTAAGNKNLAVIDKTDKGVDPEKAKLNRRVEIRVLKSKGDADIVVDNRPDEMKFKQYNRFSVLVMDTTIKQDIKKFNNLELTKDKIIEFSVKNGRYLYYFGDFTNKADAAIALNKAIDKGYKNAQIIDYFALNKENEFVVTNPVKYTKKYTIQIQAVNKPIILHSNPIMAETKKYVTKDGLYRYTYKEYDDLNVAKLDLKKVIDAGFTDAMIIEVAKLQK